jgi:hypothetical protein
MLTYTQNGKYILGPVFVLFSVFFFLPELFCCMAQARGFCCFARGSGSGNDSRWSLGDVPVLIMVAREGVAYD